MTEKEVRKLKRKDLLQLLLEEAENVAKLKIKLEECQKKDEEHAAQLDKLVKKLDEKDLKIKKLEAMAEGKDKVIIGLNDELCSIGLKNSAMRQYIIQTRENRNHATSITPTYRSWGL